MKLLLVFLVSVILLVGIFTFNACQSLNSPIEDYTWILTSWTHAGAAKALLPDIKITAFFNGEDKTVSGSGGCNHYSGTYSVDGLTLSITDIAATEMSCGEQKDGQEKQYLDALITAANFEIEHGNLILYCGGDTLHFKREDGSTTTPTQWGQ